MVGGVKAKAGISGPCVACDEIVSFKAPSCVHCGHPNAGEEAAVEALEPIEKAIRKDIKKPTGELTKADLEKVTSLDLDDNQLTDITALKELTQLTRLYLHNNQLTDVTALKKLTQLKTLGLRSNPDLTKAQIAELRKALPKCIIGHNATK